MSMSTIVRPALSGDALAQATQQVLARERDWLLAALHRTLAALRSGLLECDALLAPVEPDSTLVVSSTRSETIKGYVTRRGTRIVKADVNIRLMTLPPPPRLTAFLLRLASDPNAPAFTIPPLSAVRTLIAQSLDVVDATTYTGDARNAPFMAGQLQLLLDLIRQALRTLKGSSLAAAAAATAATGASWATGADTNSNASMTADDFDPAGPWWEQPLDEHTFDPPLPPTLAVHLSLADASLVMTFRTLMILPPGASADDPGSSSNSGSGSKNGGTISAGAMAPASGGTGADTLISLRQRLGLAARLPQHDETGRTFSYRGQAVRVREKVRVESQDPGLISVLAKLGALEFGVRAARANLAAVRGETPDEDD